MKRRQLLHAGLQLGLFDTEQAPAATGAAFAAPPPDPSPLPPSSGPQRRRVRIADRIIEYSLRRARRRSIGFVIEDDGLRISAPRWVTLREIEEAVLSKQRWIARKLDELRQRQARKALAPAPWRNGSPLVFLGNTLALRTEQSQPGNIRRHETELIVPIDSDETADLLRQSVQQWLQSEARQLFAQKLAHFAQRLGVSFRSFALSDAKTQWGSCTAQGKIRLNWRLIHLPHELIDYVIAHELAHLREMNHGPRFWATVKSVLPDFDNARKSLRRHSPLMYAA